MLKPGIRKQIDTDLQLLRRIARVLNRFWRNATHIKPLAIVDELSATLADELDFRQEAANGSYLKRFYPDSKVLHIPDMHWALSSSNVLVSEYLDGIPLTERATLRAQGYDTHEIAQRMLKLFFEQVFVHSYFHADLHPGNLLIRHNTQAKAELMAVDFGMMGSLTPFDQRYIALNLLAFMNRDYRQVALLHIQSGWVPADTRLDRFEAAIRKISEPVFSQPLDKISLGSTLGGLIELTRDFHIHIQPQLLLLQKSLISVEGLCRSLHPELDVWSISKPFLERWLKQRFNIGPLLKKLPERLLECLEGLEVNKPAAPQSTAPADNKAKPSCSFMWVWLGFCLLGLGVSFVLYQQHLLLQSTLTQTTERNVASH